MGWDYIRGASKSAVIEKRTATIRLADGGFILTLRQHERGPVLWTVRESRSPDGSTRRWIGCDILRRQPGFGWGYKPMEEAMHPFTYHCPLEFLTMVPAVCAEWRDGVHRYWRALGSPV